jgi:hypothetical protein
VASDHARWFDEPIMFAVVVITVVFASKNCKTVKVSPRTVAVMLSTQMHCRRISSSWTVAYTIRVGHVDYYSHRVLHYKYVELTSTARAPMFNNKCIHNLRFWSPATTVITVLIVCMTDAIKRLIRVIARAYYNISCGKGRKRSVPTFVAGTCTDQSNRK